jgi:plasmid maintenance system antidote protein VapI
MAKVMRMKNPPHPGQHIPWDCRRVPISLGVTRLTLSNLMNGKSGISPEMAIRLSKAFGGGPEVCWACRPSMTWRKRSRMPSASR